MHVRLVGIDCATQDANIGVAFGHFTDETLTVLEAVACTKEKRAAQAISDWLSTGTEPALLAVDAPLGWPQTLSRVLATHRAGEELKANAHDMFRRATDVFIKQKRGKTPWTLVRIESRGPPMQRFAFFAIFAQISTLKGFHSRGDGHLKNPSRLMRSIPPRH